MKLTEEERDRGIEVNLPSYFLCSREAAKVMKQQQFACIINISSRAWSGAFGQFRHSSSKGAIVSLARTLALEMAKKV